MSSLEIRPLDPRDDAALDAWHAAYLSSHEHGREVGVPWMKEEVRAQLTVENPGQRTLAFGGYVDGRAAVTGTIEMPLQDNLRLAHIELDTRPDLRNRGHGGAMLAHLEAVARKHDRSVLVTETATPYGGPPDGAGHPNVDFLVHRGFTFALGDVMRVLDLPTDQALLRRLADEAAARHQGYQIRQFRDRVPDDLVESFGRLIGRLNTEAPQGELAIEEEVFDEARIRADEEVFRASGRTKYTTVAVRDGEVAAYSDLVVPAHDPTRVYQWGTLAAKEHRGHRLGLATKARNLLWLQRELPRKALLVTFNAEVNAHMIAVNEALGFRPVERLGEFQKQL
ncbi:MAG TPA: PE-PGRS family protein [Nocardioidaceae bacterium]|nr:PE-PGRS family protein [Nocardioidaceae bacterium]